MTIEADEAVGLSRLWQPRGIRFWLILFAFMTMIGIGKIEAAWSHHDWRAFLQALFLPVVYFQCLCEAIGRRYPAPVPDMSDINRSYQLKARWIKQAGRLVLTVVFAAYFYSNWDGTTNFLPITTGIWWLGFAGLGACTTVIQLYYLLVSVPFIELSPAGITCPALFKGTLAWDNIVAIRMSSRFNTSFFKLELRKPVVAGPLWRRWLLRCFGKDGPLKQSLSMSGHFCDVDTAQLFKAIERRVTLIGTF